MEGQKQRDGFNILTLCCLVMTDWAELTLESHNNKSSCAIIRILNHFIIDYSGNFVKENEIISITKDLQSLKLR